MEELIDVTTLTDEELVALPLQYRDGTLSSAAMLEMLRRLKAAIECYMPQMPESVVQVNETPVR